jgi:hypothetical protein
VCCCCCSITPLYRKGIAGSHPDCNTKLPGHSPSQILGTFRFSPTIPSEVETVLPLPAIRLKTTLCQYAFWTRKLSSNRLVKEAIQQLQSILLSDSDSKDPDYNNYIHQTQKRPPLQLERIVQFIQSILSSPEEQLIPYCFSPWQKHASYRIVLSTLSKD